MNIQVEPDQYWSDSYNSKERFFSYWYQIQEVVLLHPKEVLEIGVGNGFFSKQIKERNIKITTLDFDQRLHPDVVGSLLELPFADNSFEVVACFEVLEHLPFEDFKRGLAQILRVSKKYAVISVPDVNKIMRLSFQISKIQIKKMISLPYFKKNPVIFNGEHYWEIGKDGYPLDKIKEEIEKSGFTIEKTYRPFETPYQRFFVLKKKSTL